MTKEPVVTLVVALIAAAGALLAAFGVNVSDAQIAAISAFVVAALTLAFWVRSQVTPTKKVGSGETGQAQPLTLLVYVIVIVILVFVLLEVADRL